MLRKNIAPLLFLALLAFSTWVRAEEGQLVQQLAPWLEIVSGKQTQFNLTGSSKPLIDGREQPISFSLTRYDDEAFDLSVEHEDYAIVIQRRADSIAFHLPKHQTTFVGNGSLSEKELEQGDHLRPAQLLDRLVSSGSQAKMITQLFKGGDVAGIVQGLQALSNATYAKDKGHWEIGSDSWLRVEEANSLSANIDGTTLKLTLKNSASEPAPSNQWKEGKVVELSRVEIERQLARGSGRALEVLLPSQLLTSPNERTKKVQNGELRWIDGHRVVLLRGTPSEIGIAHGQLLKQESMRCIDSVLYAFGTVQTVVTGRWFRQELEAAYARLSPHIPERHKIETRALAASLELDPDLIEAINVFPELFHCSGFAVFGSATKDGKLYHGRVLDYMTAIGLQDAATTFIVAADGQIPFANVGYAGFIGSVSGMNAEKVSLGEMGGRGEGQWDGVPMATLMRRALEECSSLDQVKQLWTNSPRTCEYYYVFADGKDRSAVGVAATPTSLQFVGPGEGHELLGEGIRDAVVLSAGSRLEELRKRVQSNHGQIDVAIAQSLMCRPVAMESNLHNVLFVPEDGVLFVANASHKQPAAERPYVRLDLNELLKSMPAKNEPAVSLKVNQTFRARDSLMIAAEGSEDARQCLAGLCWPLAEFDVRLQSAQQGKGNWLVRFPSARPSGVDVNDTVAMEWYQAQAKDGTPLHAPAAVVVHESGSGMTVGRLMANALRAKGIHTFMIQLPYYGVRRPESGKPTGEKLGEALCQGIVDVRRAHDAVAALPYVDTSRIALQGTSLGGFVTATTAGLDDAYDHVFVLLAGGDLYKVLMEGKKDASKVREEFLKAGLREDQVKEMLNRIEPLRLAHRIDADNTWLFTGAYDDVVPPASSNRLAEKAKLDPSHHVKFLANHHSGIIFLPMLTQQMAEIIHQSE